MNQENSISKSIIVGVGEFKRKKLHITATVVVHSGRVEDLSFANYSGEKLKPASKVAKLLKNRSVSEVLEMSLEQWRKLCGESLNLEIHEVLLEALHRALETCLDR